jgi:hypothetical protein
MAVSNEINQAITLLETEKTNNVIGKTFNCDIEISIANMKIQALNLLKRAKELEENHSH